MTVRNASAVTEARPKSREASKQETRDALLRAGTELYLDATSEPSLDAICARAGYTRGAFYVHFKDRTEFLFAVIDNLLREFLDAVIADQGAQEPALEGGQVSETIGRFLQAAQVEHGTVKFLAQVLYWHPEIKNRYAVVLQGALQRVAALIGREQQQGIVRQDIPNGDVALILVATAMGIAGLMDSNVDLDLSTLVTSADRVLRKNQAG